MSLIFPSSPSSGTIVTRNGRSYKWNGKAWEFAGGGTPVAAWSSVPELPTSSGTAGDVAYDGTYFYTATAADTWKRVAWDAWRVYTVPLLLRFNNNFTNSGSATVSVNANSVTSSATQSKFGGYSAYFSGSSSYINFANEPGLAFGTDDFTLEMWVYFIGTAGCNLWDGRSEGAVSSFPVISVNGSGKIGFDPNGIRAIEGPTVSADKWYHVAVSRASGVSRLFVDGIQYGGDAADTNNYANDETGPVIGIYKPALAAPFSGYIDSVRVTQGLARYTSSFFAPAVEFPAP